MTVSEFRQRLAVYTRGDIKMPDFEEFKILAGVTAAEIMRSVTPLEMIELDTLDFEAEYHLDDKYFVRKFKPPLDAKDGEIDFLDEKLIDALAYGMACKRTGDIQKIAKYKNLYLRALSVYETNNFDERSYDLDHSLAARGWAKPYDINYALNTHFVWDEAFLDKLDYWMANISTTKNLSYRKFVYLFIDFQNGKGIDRRDMKELDIIMKKRIRP